MADASQAHVQRTLPQPHRVHPCPRQASSFSFSSSIHSTQRNRTARHTHFLRKQRITRRSPASHWCHTSCKRPVLLAVCFGLFHFFLPCSALVRARSFSFPTSTPSGTCTHFLPFSRPAVLLALGKRRFNLV